MKRLSFIKSKNIIFLFFFYIFLLQNSFLHSNEFYWEIPQKLTSRDSRFPQAVSNSNSSAIFWQEIDTKNSLVYLSGKIKMADAYGKDSTWKNVNRFAGPFSYSGEVPDLFSVTMNKNGKICISVLSGPNSVSVFTSDDGGNTFTRSNFSELSLPVVAPRVYSLNSGDFILFASLGKDESFSLLTSKSSDGITWSQFKPFEPAQSFRNPFLPVLVSSDKGELLYFQAQYNSGTRLSYQLYSTRSRSNASSWTSAELVTGQESLLSNSNDVYTSFHNQRPSLLEKDGKYYIAWERNHFGSENSYIYFAEVDLTGKIISQVEQITTSGNASRPVLFDFNNKISLTWFDTRQGLETVYFSQKNGYLWEEHKLSTTGNSSTFSYPMISNSGKNLSFVWQTNNSIYQLSTDTTVRKPVIRPTTYTLGLHSKDEKVRYQILLPEDSSGIAGYSWSWSQDKNVKPSHSLMAMAKEKFVNVKAQEEGEYYFSVCALDYAGNWSEPQVVSYYLDLTPPPKPIIIMPEFDSYGFLSSNTFDMMWAYRNETLDNINDIAGYSWKFEKVENLDKELLTSKKHPLKISDSEVKNKIAELKEKYKEENLKKYSSEPTKRIMQKKTDAQFINYGNGVYIFSVRAIDQVGNVGEASYAVFYLNKFEPYTHISSIKKSQDIFGNTSLSIDGSGFTYDGIISEIYITEQNNNEPSIVLNYANGDYKINSNNSISSIKLSNNLKQGKYYISLVHTDRGIYKSNIAFTVLENGTVKIEKEYEYVPNWFAYTKIGKYNVQVSLVLFIILMIFVLAGLIFAFKGIISTIKDFNLVKLEVNAILQGELMPSLKNQKLLSLKKKGGGLRLKLILFTVVLVLMVSLLVSIPLGYLMMQTQEQSLSKGLKDRVNVLLESLSSGTKAYMPSENVLELSYLPGQSSALEEANFVTITGFKANENDDENSVLNYVWASNDNNVTGDGQLIINTSTFTPGLSELTDENILKITDSCKKINDKAKNIVGEIGNNIAKLNSEGASLALKTDTESVARRDEIADITTQLTTRMTESLSSLSIENSSSYPIYDPTMLDRNNTEYLFYRPVLYRSGTSQNYVRAIVFISVSTRSLIGELEAAQKTIMFTAFVIALFGILIGTVCAIMLASIIVNPIRRLAKHVQMIGQTVDKEKLAGKEIEIKSKDEIGQLGDSVNEMTRSLVKAAQDEHLLMDGKVVQQTFLPLSTDERGAKQTTANIKEGALEFVGYYEGASGVSGDYFDYKKLDDRWHIVIKCDVSGHGVPAALLMTVVATLFRKHFETWSFNKNGTDLTKLVCTINDFIEGLGIKGKFATIILALIDTKTGDVYLCNAGDNIVHIYDSREKKQKVLTLQETPAAGPLPTFMVEMKGGFKLEKTHLNKGDILFLYTDGIEEATRKFRDQNFAVTKCAEPGLKEGDVHGNHKVGLDSEQMEPERVSAIIEAALNKQVYVLEKYHNPVPGERLEFDFSNCDGTVQDAILALCSVEKVFRFYKDPEVTANDLVKVDKKIDTYLKKCFNRYDYYCSNQQEIGEESSYLYYTNLREDEQLDDLTLVAVRM